MGVIAFIHPDLGIGGAERFVCDAALALQKKGHTVKIFTSHHDPTHCFEETSDGTLSVQAVGDWLPRHILWKFYALWAYIRMFYVAIYLVFLSDYDPDVVICDQVSACIPILQLSKKARVMFYCHFPDLLLTQRRSLVKKIYRTPIDYTEEVTTGMANLILVNSKFTAKTFHETFLRLKKVKPIVLYPTLSFATFKDIDNIDEIMSPLIRSETEFIFVSINRYERKKNLGLALRALESLRFKCNPKQWQKVHLIIAGGYDERNEENRQHYKELQALAYELNVDSHVTFVRSFSDEQKVAFLKSALALLYTPSNEHFGLVPIEAMYMKCPVVACNSGGPLETVKHEQTGYLCPPTPDDFGAAMMRLIERKDLREDIGENGHQHVIDNFSFDSFANQLDKLVKSLYIEWVPKTQAEVMEFAANIFSFCFFGAVFVIGGITILAVLYFIFFWPRVA